MTHGLARVNVCDFNGDKLYDLAVVQRTSSATGQLLVQLGLEAAP